MDLVTDARSPEQELKDLLHTAIGLGVMTFQRAQVKRRQLLKDLQQRANGQAR